MKNPEDVGRSRPRSISGSILAPVLALSCFGLVEAAEPIPGSMPGPPAGVEATVAAELAAAQSALDTLAPGDRAGRARAWGELGRLHAAYELWDGARSALLEARSLAPEAGEWAYLLGYVEAQRGETEAAVAALAAATALEPADVAAWIRLGEARLALGDLTAARQAFERARDRAPAAAHFGLGRVAARRDDHAAAVRHFEQTLRRQPGASQVHVPLALAYRRLGRADDARRQLDRRGERRVIFPDPAITRLAASARGGALHKFRGDEAVLEGRLDVAAQAYRRAVAADPESFFYRKSLGLTLNQLGDPHGAAAELGVASELLERVDPAQRASEGSRIYYALGGLAVNRGDLAAAAAYFQRAVELDPDDADAWLQLGNLAGRAGRLEEAAERFGRALDADPDHPTARLQRATTLMDLGRFADAIPDLRRRLELVPDDAQARRLLDLALARALPGSDPR